MSAQGSEHARLLVREKNNVRQDREGEGEGERERAHERERERGGGFEGRYKLMMVTWFLYYGNDCPIKNLEPITRRSLYSPQTLHTQLNSVHILDTSTKIGRAVNYVADVKS